MNSKQRRKRKRENPSPRGGWQVIESSAGTFVPPQRALLTASVSTFFDFPGRPPAHIDLVMAALRNSHPSRRITVVDSNDEVRVSNPTRVVAAPYGIPGRAATNYWAHQMDAAVRAMYLDTAEGASIERLAADVATFSSSPNSVDRLEIYERLQRNITRMAGVPEHLIMGDASGFMIMDEFAFEPKENDSLSPALGDGTNMINGYEPCIVRTPPRPPVAYELDAEYDVMKDPSRRRVSNYVGERISGLHYVSTFDRYGHAETWTASGPARFHLSDIFRQRLMCGHDVWLREYCHRAPVLSQYLMENLDWFDGATHEQVYALQDTNPDLLPGKRGH